MTTCACAQARAGSRYPFLTLKERDIETGLDYFLARYYSSIQGRFTSPDEFSGGPDELYNFAEDAADNPTFYADLTNPQSLNKYQYTYNNPVNMTDEDGHCPICAAVVEVAGTVLDVVITVKTLRDPNASTAEKVGTVVGTAAGVILPAGGYSAAIKAIVRTGKQANNLPAPNQDAPTQKGQQGQTQNSGQTAEKTKNLADAEKKGIPKDQLGPSGKPKVHTVNHPTKKRAEDAARADGQGKPAKDTRPKKDGPHFHPTNKDGTRKKGKQNVHHEYPG